LRGTKRFFENSYTLFTIAALNPAHPTDPAPARFIVGIDLGTTNSAVAYVDTRDAQPAARIFRIPQLVAPGETEERETLPSFHYEPAQAEFDREALRLPWDAEQPAGGAVGAFARDHGANVPGRLIVSAKSWLCHSGVDRTAELLPWHSAPDAKKLSPADASARFLGHIRAAWNHSRPEHLLEKQDVVVTIPASFDEVARELTVTAARRAGLPRIVLLEEPQAAFYAWVDEHRDAWHETLRPGQKILVCDIGGGTSDFTLIEVRPGEGGRVRFHRFAVGDHLILGGDNLDLALAHFVEERMGVRLEPRQWGVLVRRCQQAKETLLGKDAPERLTLSVPAGGARLIGGARQAEVTRDEAAKLLVDGFLPFVALDEKPAKRSSGFQEFGLPYAADSAITRYLAAFLTAHRSDTSGDSARPDVVLFNGGLFESPLMRERLIDVLCSWFSTKKKWKPPVLKNTRLDLAVALGAAHYGMVRRGLGVRITGGLARSYYIGIRRGEENAALCLVPAGLEEGEEVKLLDQKFDLLVRQPAEFPLYVSSARTTDKPGSLVPVDEEQLSALPPIRTALRAKTEERGTVPVHLHARLTEIGTLDVWCSEIDGERRWKLQFDVRAATRTDIAAHRGLGERAGFVDEQIVQKCAELIRETFAGASPPEALVKRMEEAAGMGRLDWPPSLLRELWQELMQAEKGRARSPAHEARWLNLLGFALRPGYGFAVDDWRVAQTWHLVERKVVHHRNEMCRAEWWILWRRIAGGLTAGQQRTLADPLLAALKKAHARSESPWGSHESAEVWRLLGSLESLDPGVKLALGDLLLDRLGKSEPQAWLRAALWAMGRLGARVPMAGPLNALVPPETAEKWLTSLCTSAQPGDELFFAITQLSRHTGDRYRDISETARDDVLTWMSASQAPAHYIELIRAGGQLREEEQDMVFGETLPHGLRLMT
jgi:molecular chaperone DnaK (HSP70)